MFSKIIYENSEKVLKHEKNEVLLQLYIFLLLKHKHFYTTNKLTNLSLSALLTKYFFLFHIATFILLYFTYDTRFIKQMIKIHISIRFFFN